jgi:predicted N-acetyltransferase YhbS
MSVSSLPSDLAATLRPERLSDDARVQALIERAFGPGRYAKAAERLREGTRPDLELSFVAWAGSEAVGCVRMWPIVIGETPAWLLGPFAVEDAWRSRGLGAQLMEQACAAAKAKGCDWVLLVGDEPYFGRFGFSAVPPGRIVMPGPVDRRRVLWRSLAGGAEPCGPAHARVAS